MKMTIYKYFFNEFLRYFIITLFAIAAIVWTIQAVNFLDLIVEDGHAFNVYFLYSFLTLSKVITKLIPFCFLISIILTIIKLEKDNELIVLWTSGLNKINLVNLIIKISVLMMFIQIILTSSFNPKMLNLSRTLLKNSEFSFIPSLLKVKDFNDSVESLTVFVESKDDNEIFYNIFIYDDGKIISKIGSTSSTIFAKSGYLSEDEKNLILFNGNIQKITNSGEVNIINFKKTSLNLLGISTKGIFEPKIQETGTLKIINCLLGGESKHNCNDSKKAKQDSRIEINKRFGMPFYMPLISLFCCFLLTSRKDKKFVQHYKYIYFTIGILILIISNIFVRYSGMSIQHTAVYYLLPILLLPIIYYLLIKTFKHENLT